AGFSGDGGPATSASLNLPIGIAVDATGNVYVADVNNSRIRKISTGGIISTYAGNAVAGFSGDGGPAANASLSNASHLTLDSAGNMFIADNGRVRRVGANGIITTFAGGGSGGDGSLATDAALGPFDVVVDPAGNVFVTSGQNVKKILAAPPS